MKVEHTTVPGACGVGVACDFNADPEAWGDPLLGANEGGCGWLSAGFINTDNCREVYTQLLDKYELVWRSPTRVNVNSGNEFFFAIFDTTMTNVPTGIDKRGSYEVELRKQVKQHKAWEF